MTAARALYSEPDSLHDLVPQWALDAAFGDVVDNSALFYGREPGGTVLQFPDRRRVVGLHGFAQTGKDSIASYLVDEGWEQVTLAAPILDAMLRLNPIVAADNRGRFMRFADVYEEEGYEGAKKTDEFRRIMQDFGTEVGRDFLGGLLGLTQSMWLEIADRKITAPGRYVISDVRFRDEVEWVRQNRGVLVKVKRPGYGPVNGHVSDAGLPDHLFDHVIDNDGTLDDLHTKVRFLLGDA